MSTRSYLSLPRNMGVDDKRTTRARWKQERRAAKKAIEAFMKYRPEGVSRAAARKAIAKRLNYQE